MENELEIYTIRDNEGAIICTGICAENEDEAIENFIEKYPRYKADEVYASIENWF